MRKNRAIQQDSFVSQTYVGLSFYTVSQTSLTGTIVIIQ